MKSVNLVQKFSLEPGRISSPMEPVDHSTRSGDETDCSNYRGIPLFLSTTYKTLPSIPLSSLTPYSNGNIGIISTEVNVKQLPITYSVCSQIRQNKWEPFAAVRRLQESPHLVSTRILYRVIKKSLCTWLLQCKSQVHEDFLITLYIILIESGLTT